MAGLAAWRVRSPRPRRVPSSAALFTTVSDLHGLVTSDSRTLGSRSGPIKLEEFSDFQCPFCLRLSTVLDSFRVEHHDSVGITYRNFPLTTIHPMAFQAALAGECAGAQRRFDPMYHVLFAHQREFGRVAWAEFAELAGVRDAAAFETCMHDSVFAPRIRRDILAGKRLGITGTPTLIFGDVRIDGAVSVAVLDSLLDAADRSVKFPRSR